MERNFDLQEGSQARKTDVSIQCPATTLFSHLLVSAKELKSVMRCVEGVVLKILQFLGNRVHQAPSVSDLGHQSCKIMSCIFVTLITNCLKLKKKRVKSKTKCTGCQSEWHYCIVRFLLPGALHFENTCCGFSMIIFPLPVLYLPYCKYPFVQSCFSFSASRMCVFLNTH